MSVQDVIKETGPKMEGVVEDFKRKLANIRTGRATVGLLDVVMVDRRGFAKGSTPASTALVQYDIDMPLLELADLYGREFAESVYRIARDALDRLCEYITRHHIECGLRLRPTLYLASSASDVEFLQDETRARKAVGLEVAFLDGRQLRDEYHLERDGALRSAVSFELHPLQLTHGLLRAAKAAGVRMYNHTTVTRFHGAAHVATDRGYFVRAKHLLFAGGYETPEQFGSVAKLVSLKSTYAVSTAPLDPAQLWPERALLWEHASPYFYARTTPENRILIGGEDEPFVDPTRRDALIESKTRTLLQTLRNLTGIETAHAEYAWAGTFAETADALPIIGPAPEMPECLLALGYGGNGFTFSFIAAQILRDHIVQRVNLWAPFFRFDRAEA